MRITHYYICAFLLALIVPSKGNCKDAGSRLASDTLEVHFRVGQSEIDLGYANNEKVIADFTQLVRQHYAGVPKENMQLNVYAGASPEGPSELNRRLGEQRGLALKSLLLDRLGDVVEHVYVVNQGARWGGLYKMIEQSDEPWKFQVMEILSKKPEKDEWKVDPREAKLRKLRNGVVWQALNQQYLPELRSSGSAVLMQLTEEAVRDTLVIRDTIVYLPEPCMPFEEPADTRPVWAVKTNLLLWGVIAPNVQVERALGTKNRWSIEAEVFWPWWIWSHNAHAEQFGNLGVELRYWLGDRTRHHCLDGWHIGGGLAGGYYDFEWKRHEGWQGEYLNIYCNFGYQKRWGSRKQWAVDGGLALGYIPTKYRHYLGSSQFPVGHEERNDYHLMWQNSGWNHILGLTHANITIAYIFGAKGERPQATKVVEPAPVIKERARVRGEQAQKQPETKAELKQAKAQKQPETRSALTADDKAAAKEAAKAEKAAAKQKAAAEKEAAKQAAAAAKQKAAAEKEAAKQAAAAEKRAAKEKAAAEKAAKQSKPQAQAVRPAKAEKPAKPAKAAKPAVAKANASNKNTAAAAQEQAAAEKAAAAQKRAAERQQAQAAKQKAAAEKAAAKQKAQAEKKAAKQKAQAQKAAAKQKNNSEKAAARAAYQAEKAAEKAAKAGNKTAAARPAHVANKRNV